MAEVREIIQSTKAYLCQDCGKCTATCPVARHNPAFSPRKLVGEALGRPGELLQNRSLWSCITCAACEEKCQSDVGFTALVRSLREKAIGQHNGGECTHGGVLQALDRIMTAPDLLQDRLGWVDGDLKVAAAAETVYFAGCQPHFDIIFRHLGVNMASIGKGAIRLLNCIGITPALLSQERCCGHDLLWAGDEAGFLRLARHNVAEIGRSGAKRVVTTCPECYYTLKFDYPRRLGGTGFEVAHISEVLAERAGDVKLRRIGKKVTYHDPCRLGRFAGIYDAPRKVLGAIPGLEIVEMPHTRRTALCCGTQAWMDCGTVNHQIQADLLAEAAATGADLLVTACPKCQIHLRCAMQGVKGVAQMGIEDITSLVAGAFTGGEGTNG